MADVRILVEGYVREADGEVRVGSTVSLVRDGDAVVIIDPGLVSAPSAILDPLREAGVMPEQVTDVVLSHHHPDHTMHAGLFGNANVHDVMATYRRDLWIDRPAEGFRVSPGVTLMETPGHTREDITTLVETDDGVVAFTHLWWSADGPADDPFTFDRQVLRSSRERVLALAARIVPGHGPVFTPGPDTPR